MMIRTALSALAMFASVSAAAESFTEVGNITQLHFYEGLGGVMVKHENMINPDSCTRSDQYILRQGHPFFKEFYSLLLAAHIAGQPLKLGINGCEQGFPSLIHVYSIK